MRTTPEFEILRGEITESDKICIAILGFSFTLSGTVLGLKENDIFQLKELILLIQIVWVMSYLYITNKRFAILTIANYIKTELETQKDLNLNWESWLRDDKLPKPIIDIYLVETITCSIPIALIAIFSCFKGISALAILSVLISLGFVLFFILNYRQYNKLRKRFVSV